ncbi:MAG: NAD-dependent epimerase/dehydratase family protein [Deinococcaceae bacterium]
MNILLTGGTGFVGSYLAERLLARGYAVTLMGRNFSGVQHLLYAGAQALHCDLRDYPKVIQACKGMDVVCHVGALSKPWGPDREFWETNVLGTQAVIDGCLRFGVRRLVHTSTPSVLFDGRDHHLLNEDTPYPKRLLSAYAKTKKIAEEKVLSVQSLLEVVILRPKAIYGHGDHALLPRLIQAAKEGRLCRIGNGKNRVDLTHVEDVAQALMLATEKPLPNRLRPIYHITGGEHVLLWNVIEKTLAHNGLFPPKPTLPLPILLPMLQTMERLSRLTQQEPLLTPYTALLLAKNQTYDISRAQKDLGYSPQISIEEGLKRTLAHTLP